MFVRPQDIVLKRSRSKTGETTQMRRCGLKRALAAIAGVLGLSLAGCSSVQRPQAVGDSGRMWLQGFRVPQDKGNDLYVYRPLLAKREQE